MCNADTSVILRNPDAKELAHDFMVQPVIAACHAWWQDHDSASAAEKFGTDPRINPAI
jgi:hypothetical protein